jgi:hypothetical protein
MPAALDGITPRPGNGPGVDVDAREPSDRCFACHELHDPGLADDMYVQLGPNKIAFVDAKPQGTRRLGGSRRPAVKGSTSEYDVDQFVHGAQGYATASQRASLATRPGALESASRT